ncbi:hypothetical protein [Holospora elegans]|nr:hypothetical protein [Holospora elegans]
MNKITPENAISLRGFLQKPFANTRLLKMLKVIMANGALEFLFLI